MSAEDRKAAIVRAALPLFARQGYAATTTKEVARASGVSEPLLYKHFPGKEALYLEIQKFSCLDDDPVARCLGELEPSASTLVHLVYYIMRALTLGRPIGSIPWDTRHRLMLNSLLEDGAFARLAYENRLNRFCGRIETCLKKAIAGGHVVKTAVTPANAALFAFHVGVWIAVAHLPPKPAIDYNASDDELLRQSVCFVLRGMGMTDKAIATYFNPRALALFFRE